MPTEFLHGLYDRGQGAGLDDFWDSYKSNPLFAGGFLWTYVDEAVKRTDQGGRLDSDGPNGPDGIVGPRPVSYTHLHLDSHLLWIIPV